MSSGIRARRGFLYQYEDRGAGPGATGLIDSLYVWLPNLLSSDGAYWCRVVYTSGDQVTIGMHAEEHIDAVIFFSSDVWIPPKSVVVVGGVIYKTISVYDRPQMRETEIHVRYTDANEIQLSATGSLSTP